MVKTLRLAGRSLTTIFKEYLRHDGPLMAAGIAFFAFFSVFPLFMLSLAGLTYFVPIDRALFYTHSLASMYLPVTTLSSIETNVRMVAGDRTKISLTSLLLLLWSGRQLFRALEVSLLRTWDLPARRNMFHGNLLSMSLVLLCGAVASTGILITLFFSAAQTLMQRWRVPNLGFLSFDASVTYAWIHSWVIIPGLVMLIFLLLYMILPLRRVSLKAAMPGAFFAAVAWKISSLMYVDYMVWFGRLSSVYSGVFGIVGMLIFLYVESVVFLLGAELIRYVLEHQAKSPPPPARKRSVRKVRS
jgi:membrane protein